MSVTQTRTEYDNELPDVTRNRDAVAGERAVKLKRTAYLPPTTSMCTTTSYLENGYQQIIGARVSREGTASYNKYLSLAYFYGATGRTVDGLTGLIFRKNPEIKLSTQLEYLLDNVDGKGNSLRKQSQRACEEAFISHRSGLLVDFPRTQQHVSVAEAEAGNMRPKILHYPFESIINWFYQVIENELKLALVVLLELVEQINEDYLVQTVKHYRVLQLVDGVCNTSLFDESGVIIDEKSVVMVNGAPAREIPFYFIQVGAENKSVITDLVDANYNHYRFFADYAIKEHTSAFPIFYETGAIDADQNMAIGPGAKWSNPNSDARFGVLQSASDGGSMRQYLMDMETRMAALGAEMLKPRIAGAESAEAKSLDKVAQDSTTGNVANNVSEAYRKALNFAAGWLGVAEDQEFRLNTDYNPIGLTGQDLTALVGALQGGAMSFSTFYENLQRGEVANPARTEDEEKALIQNSELGLNTVGGE
jgi:hypothetical protein